MEGGRERGRGRKGGKEREREYQNVRTHCSMQVVGASRGRPGAHGVSPGGPGADAAGVTVPPAPSGHIYDLLLNRRDAPKVPQEYPSSTAFEYPLSACRGPWDACHRPGPSGSPAPRSTGCRRRRPAAACGSPSPTQTSTPPPRSAGTPIAQTSQPNPSARVRASACGCVRASRPCMPLFVCVCVCVFAPCRSACCELPSNEAAVRHTCAASSRVGARITEYGPSASSSFVSFGSLSTRGTMSTRKGYSDYLWRVLSPAEMRLDRRRADGGDPPGYVHEHGEDERARLARTGLGNADHILCRPE